ncbi:hypothetical protein ACHAWF_005635 [Thalassiosira exigua]
MSAQVETPHPSEEETRKWIVTPVLFHDFAQLDTTLDRHYLSPQFSSLGHSWMVDVCPGGDRESDPGLVALFLRNKTERPIRVEYSMIIKGKRGQEVESEHMDVLFQARTATDGIDGWGCSNFEERSVILDELVNGSLMVEVRLRRPSWSLPIPSSLTENPMRRGMLNLFEDEESADVVFEVDNECEQKAKKSRKRTRASQVKLHAHRLILKHCAPDLADICGVGSGKAFIPIHDVKPDIFRHLLYYVYGGRVADYYLRNLSRDFIDAANRYGVVNLKLEAEAWYVKSTTITVHNMMELLLYADAMNCALLKEAAMDFILENRSEVIEKVALNDAPAGLLAELLAATARKLGEGDDDDLSAMRIEDIRKKLHDKGIDFDGSRETLIATLQENA